MSHKPEDVGLTEAEVDESARKMAMVLLSGPDYWEQIPSTLIRPEHLDKFRTIAAMSPERLEKSFLLTTRDAAHAIVDVMADNMELWAMANSRGDLFMSIRDRLAIAEAEAAKDDEH